MTQRPARGFTLLELLVVIAIIGLLASVVIANFAGARMKAYNSASTQIAHEYHTAFELYYADHGYYPDPGDSSVYCLGNNPSCPGGVSASLNAAISPYITGLPYERDVPFPGGAYVGPGYWCLSGFGAGTGKCKFGILIWYQQGTSDTTKPCSEGNANATVANGATQCTLQLISS